MSRRFLFTIVLAGVCLAVLASRVETEFKRHRYIVRSWSLNAQEPVVAVALPDLSRLAGNPMAIVMRLRGGDEAVDVGVALDGLAVTTVTVPARKEILVNASTAGAVGPGQQLLLTGTRAGWRLVHLEVANVYGFSHRVPKFVIVPRERPLSRPVPIWGLALFTLVALCARPRLDWPVGRAARLVYWTAATAVLVFFAATLLLDTFTRYKILPQLDTFFLCAAVLYAEPITRAWRRVQLHARRAPPVVAPYLPHMAAAVLVLWSVGQLYRPDTGFTSLILFGEQFERNALPALRAVPHHIEPGSGYDGQFYAQLALDPLLRSEQITSALDNVAYRGRRILFSWTAYLLGFGQPWYVLQVFALLNVVCWLILGVLLLRWMPPGSVKPTVAWMGCMFGDGLLASMRYSLVDGPSALLLALAVRAVEENRHGMATGILTLSGLARETNLLGGAILIPDKLTLKNLATFALRGILIVAPFALWTLYLWKRTLSSAVAGSRNFGIFMPYVEKWQDTIRLFGMEGWNSDVRFSLLGIIGLTTQALVLLWCRDSKAPWWRLGIAYMCLMLVLGPAVWEGHPGAIGRIMIPMTIAFNILLPRGRWFWPLWILGNAGVMFGLEVMSVPWASEW